MTWKNGSSTYSSKTKTKEDSETSRKDKRTTSYAMDRLKAQSMKMMRRSKKKATSIPRRSHAVVAPTGSKCRVERVVHFELPAQESENNSEFARFRPFRRSSKFRQPLRRVSRAKGSPPPSCLARIHRILEDTIEESKLAQPNFDITSDGESEEDEAYEKLPPILLECLQNELAASDSESSDGEGGDGETYTVIPAVTVPATTTWEGDEGARHEVAPARRNSRANTLIRRRSSYRVSVRRRSLASIHRASVRRSTRRCSVVTNATRRCSIVNNATRRCSIVTRTGRRKSSALPGYVFRRRSNELRSPYKTIAQQQRKKRRKGRRPHRRPRKIVVIGDMCSGKTNLISAYCRDQFSDTYIPTILTSCMTDAEVLGEKIELVIVEVAGRIDYAKIRRCAYHKMDLVILCYSADSPTSLAAIKTHWLPELLKVAPEVPYILVGTKKDIRDEVCEVELSQKSQINPIKNSSTSCVDGSISNEDRFVSTRQGLETAEVIGAQDFIECSAMYREGTRDVFEKAAKIALRRSPRRKKKHCHRTDTCTIL